MRRLRDEHSELIGWLSLFLAVLCFVLVLSSAVYWRTFEGLFGSPGPTIDEVMSE